MKDFSKDTPSSQGGVEYDWNGNGFDPLEGNIATQAMNDDANPNNVYLYMSNYNGFFPISISNGNATYQGDGTIVLLPDPTTLDAYALTDANLTTVINQVYQARMQSYASQSGNVVAAATQAPSTLVTSAVTQATSGLGLSQAYSDAASYLTSQNMNFAFNDIANNWVGGQATIQSVQNIMVNHQNNLNSIQSAANSITDFKKKIIRGQTVLADSIRKIQNDANNFSSSPTFTQLASAFPNELGKTVSSFANSQSILGNKLSKVLPSSLTSGSAIANTIEGFINGAFNGVKPQIVNPIDKLLLDVENISNTSAAGFANFIPSNGFASFAEQQNFVNQTVNLLQNIISKFPIASKIPQVAQINNPGVANQAIASFNKSLLGLQPNIGNTISNASSQKTLNAMAQTNINQLTASASNTTYLASDPASGGSFINQPQYITLFGGEVDQSVVGPSPTLSPDLSVQSSINNVISQQLQSNQGTSFSFTQQGAGVNLFEDPILRPRNAPIDGSTGTYTLNKNTPF